MKFSQDERIILDLLKKYAFGVVQPPKHKLKYHSVEPGLAYSNTLWDWDSYWAVVALNDTVELLKDDEDFDYDYYRQLINDASKGNVLNFLDYQEEDGFIPIMIRADVENDDYCLRPNVLNAHKPFLCKSALLASNLNCDSSWVDLSKLCKLMDYYRENQFDKNSGLYFWRSDVMIGVDNNPTVFGRPANSSADIYLNSYMVSEYDALIELCNRNGKPCEKYVQEREELVKNINEIMWDERENLFFSQDILVKTNETEIFNKGLGAFWKTLPIKIEFWCCYLPLSCGVVSSERANALVKRLKRSQILCNCGVRTLSKDERQYSLTPSGNPSNWLGAVWTIANYEVYSGLVKYGYVSEADDICDKTVKMLAESIKKDGSMSESYNPDTGEGILHKMFFSWNVLVATMIKDKLTRQGEL